MKTSYIVGTIVIVVLGGAFLFMAGSSSPAKSSNPTPIVHNPRPQSVPISATPPPATSTIATLPAASTTSVDQTSGSSKAQPTIISLLPASATAGTKVTISGSGFDKTLNHIMFGDSNGRHHPDGSADNVIASVPSSDGKSLTFTVPSTGPSGILCDSTNHCIGISAMRLSPGNTFKVAVANKMGTSSAVIFTLR